MCQTEAELHVAFVATAFCLHWQHARFFKLQKCASKNLSAHVTFDKKLFLSK
jgi:predicted DNA-binding transcriptional regulator YafY